MMENPLTPSEARQNLTGLRQTLAEEAEAAGRASEDVRRNPAGLRQTLAEEAEAAGRASEDVRQNLTGLRQTLAEEAEAAGRASEDVRRNLAGLRQTLAEEAKSAGRNPEEVRLMAVTKTVPPELVNVAWEEGVRLFGENRAQELTEKAGHYAFDSGCIHFIGTLQTNKVRQIIDKVCCIQSVNSLRLAQEIEKRAAQSGRIMDVLLEVNIGGEASKTGADYGEVMELLEKIAGFSSLRVKGLMCIPPFGRDERETEHYFERMHKIFVDIGAQKIDNISMEILSMGMTGDHRLAVRHGANLVRIGTGIFGRRK